VTDYLFIHSFIHPFIYSFIYLFNTAVVQEVQKIK